MLKGRLFASFASLTLVSGLSFAGDMDLKVDGHGRLRAETRNNAGWLDGKSNYKELRVRPGFTFSSTKSTNVYLQPQATKVFGAPNGTSGATMDSDLQFHQAYVSTMLNDSITFKGGRQALNYGDELLLSSYEWNTVGRSWDALKFMFEHKWGSVDVFWADQTNKDTIAKGNDDSRLLGIYTMWDFGKYLKEFDLYYLGLLDKTNNPVKSNLTTFGLRGKSRIEDFQYRVELALQNQSLENAATGTPERKGNLYDVEIGYNFPRAWDLYLGVEYFVANDEFTQLFPEIHNYLGIADLIGMQNVKSIGLHVDFMPHTNWKVKLGWQDFKRDSSTATTYLTNAAVDATGSDYSLARASTSDKIGSEFDIEINWMPVKHSTLSLAVALFSPGDYFKNAGNQSSVTGSTNNSDSITYGYLQYTVMF